MPVRALDTPVNLAGEKVLALCKLPGRDRRDPQHLAPRAERELLFWAYHAATPRFEIGARMGWGLTNDAAGYFFDTGVGMRF